MDGLMDGRMDRRPDGQKARWTDGPTDARIDGLTVGRMDKASYRVVCPQLKTVSRLLILFVLDKASVDIRNHRAFLNHQSLTSKND